MIISYNGDMIHSYSCKNFYSIRDKVEVRFDVNNKAPKSDAYVDDGYSRLSVVEAVVGPNASGKTNAIKALSFIRHLIAETAERDVDSDIPIHTFHDNDNPTELSVEFSVRDRLFFYEFILCRERVLEETLKERSKTNDRVTYKTLASRKWNKKEKTYDVVDKVFGAPASLRLRRNASIVSRVWLADEDGLAGDIVRYWRDCVVSNVAEGGNRDDHFALHGDHLTKVAIEHFYDNKALGEQAKVLLRELDLGFRDFEKEELSVEARKIYRVVHQYGEKRFAPPLRYESSGTKRAILMLRHILEALSHEGGVAALDELDAYLHPDIVEAFVKLFISPETNPNGSQLIFSSHSHQLLAELDKQQIVLTEKNSETGSTDVWRLDDLSGIRADDNYYAKYISGAYGAKPRMGV